MGDYRIIEVKRSVFEDNNRDAERLRTQLKGEGTFLVNLMSSPGASKTTTLKRTIAALKDEMRIGVMEANIDGKDKIFAICNCNVNVCYALRTSQLFNTPNMSRSAYVAHVDPKNCVACGRCVEYCPAGAVKLGQKLCRADGTGQTYPKHALPGPHRRGGLSEAGQPGPLPGRAGADQEEQSAAAWRSAGT